MTDNQWKEDTWEHLYGEGWREEITPDSYSHPAKFSRGLIRKIYDHALEEGWLKEGSRVLDPFAGIALGALDAQSRGMHWIGVELESHFVRLATGYDCPGYDQKTWRRYHGRAVRSYKNKGEWIFCPECAREIDKSLGKKKRHAPTREPHRFMGNLELWEKNYAKLLPKWGTARIILGDSRNLLKLISDNQDATVASPPYADGCSHTGGDDPHPEHIKGGAYYGVGISGAISSPPYAEARVDGGGDNTQNVVMPDGSYPRGHDGWAVRKQASDKRYGGSDGNLGTLEDKGFEGALSSPPFGTNSADSQRPSKLTQEYAENLGKKNLHGDYGDAPGQLGRMEARDLDGVVGSPPFIAQSGGTNVTAESGTLSDPSLFERHSAGNHAKKGYGDEDGQLGAMDEGTLDGVLSSPPYADSLHPNESEEQEQARLLKNGHLSNIQKRMKGGEFRGDDNRGYSADPGNLGNLKDEGLDATIGSPPYADSMNSEENGIDFTKVKKDYPGRVMHEQRVAMMNRHHSDRKYGVGDGQLGNMKEGEIDATIGSPPYAKSEIAADLTSGVDVEERKQKRADGTWHGYNQNNPANLGTMDEGNADIAISSPPYVNSMESANHIDADKSTFGHGPHSQMVNDTRYGASEGQLGALPEGNADAIIASPPFTDSTLTKPSQGVTDQLGHTMGRAHFQEGYADNSPGQLGSMKEGSQDASIASPPFADSLYQIDSNRTDEVGQMAHRPWNSTMQGVNTPGKAWGKNEGQMGQMKDEGYDEVVSSPPFTGSTADGGWQMLGKYAEQGKLTVEQVNGDPNKLYPSWDQNRDTQYAPSPDNLGAADDDTFWSAAKKIVEQTFMALKPGGHALWVVKAYVRDKKIVDFPDQWRRLCESVGFVTVHVHRASLVEDKGTQYDLFGNAIKTETKRYSFFRRLHAQKYPELEIRHETVLCMEKPA